MNTRTLPTSIKATIAAALVGAATLAAPSAWATPVTDSDAAAIRHVCQQTLGLTVNDTDYAACVSTLNRALATAQPAERHSPPGAVSACAEVGLAPGSSGYSRCEANLDGALTQARLAPN
ncbi:hypothetical protein FBZ89_1157 [Nitrospirillum amazonense]|uniref:UrcA family protein n=1 Tax=Nitrospirillum amazonense TaxID=28077 RepID=A0A560F0Q4_9PROT|nr:hypothetical protein [Nitrospirillum amazonense]TWB15228.1 hypothetical protein FBZ89_1157 [Nitrospirillum amazonense]